MKRYVKLLAAVLTAVFMLAALPAAHSDDNEWVARVSGQGTAAFDEGEELFGYETGWAVHARIRENGRARGEFYCDLPDHPEIPPLAILGDVDRGKVNQDGSVTLEGVAIVVHLETGELLDGPFDFAVTLWPGRAGVGRFIYYDYVTGPAGDAETVTEGRIRIRLDDDD
jgi:hypothetical protein